MVDVTRVLPLCVLVWALATSAPAFGQSQEQRMVVNVASQVAEMALGASGAKPLLSRTAMAAFGLGTSVGVLLPFQPRA